MKNLFKFFKLFSVTEENNVEAMNPEGLVQFTATHTRTIRFHFRQTQKIFGMECLFLKQITVIVNALYIINYC